MHFCFLIHLSRVYLRWHVCSLRPTKINQTSCLYRKRERVSRKKGKICRWRLISVFESSRGGYRLLLLAIPSNSLMHAPLYNGPRKHRTCFRVAIKKRNQIEINLWRGDGRVESSNSNLLLLLLLLAVGKCRAPVDGYRAAAAAAHSII